MSRLSSFSNSSTGSILRRLQRGAWTRQGALSLARRMQPERAMSWMQRVLMLLVGSSLIGVGVALFKAADLGLPPYDVTLSAVSELTGLSHGQAGWSLAVVLFAVAAAFGQAPTRYGLLWVAANGVLIDAIVPLLSTPGSLTGRLAFVAGGIAAIASAIAVVAHTSSTGGAFELLTRAAEARGVRPVRFRMGMEGSVLVIGITLGGDFGIGTLAFAVAIGWAISSVNQGLADHQSGREARVADPERTLQTASAPF